MKDDDWNRLVKNFRDRVDRIEAPKERHYEIRQRTNPSHRRVVAVLHEHDESREDGVVFDLQVGPRYVHLQICRGSLATLRTFFDNHCHIADERFSTIAEIVLHSIGLAAAMTETQAYGRWVQETRGPKINTGAGRA